MPVLIPGLMTMIAAQLFDLGTFVTMIRRLGPASETNPFVVDALANHGLPGLVVGKAVLMLFIVALTMVLGRRSSLADRRVTAIVLGVSIVAGLIGGGSNALTMVSN
jgi:hypothetical protein